MVLQRAHRDPNIDDQSFWHPGTPLINWKQSSIKRQHGGWNGKGYTAHQVEVRLEDIDALIAAWATAREPMPAPDPEPAKPKRWFSLARETYPRRPSEGPTAYATRLHQEMKHDCARGTVTTLWPIETIRRRLYDKP